MIITPPSGAGAVSSVNTQTGAVVLSAADVGAASVAALSSLNTRVGTLEAAGGSLNPAFTAVAIGDSITFGANPNNVPATVANPWPSVLATLRNWTVANAGINSSTLVTGGVSPMVERWDAAVPSSTGHVFLMGGTNDFGQSRPLGNISSTDPATIYGALKIIAFGVLGKLSGGYLYLATPIPSSALDGSRNSVGYSFEQVRQAVRDVYALCSRTYRNVLLIDTTALRDALGAPGAGNADGVHLTQLGEDALGQFLAAHSLGADGTAPLPTTLFSDNFNRADGVPGSNYVVNEGNHVIVGNALTVTGGAATFTRIAAPGAVYANDGKTYVFRAMLQKHAALTFLGSLDSTQCYFVQWQDNGALNVYQRSGNGFNNLSGTLLFNSNASAELRVESTGSTHNIYFDNNLMFTFAAAPAANLNYGLFNYFVPGYINSIDNLLLTRTP